MRNTTLTNRIAALLVALFTTVGLTAMTATAIAGNGNGNSGQGKSGNGNSGGHKHHKKKKCKEGFHKESFINKKGKKKKRCVKDATIPVPVPAPAPPAASAASLSISPTTFDFGNAQHHSGPCSGCPTKAFTVTNSGGQASGTLAVSVTDTADPVTGDDEAFQTISNGCGAALAPGASCTVTMGFSPVSNGGDGDYVSVLHVTGAPGGDAQAQMSGHAQ